MLGHKLGQTFTSRFDTYLTFRRTPGPDVSAELFDQARCLTGIVAEDFDTVVRALETVRPDAVVNCIGVVKQDVAAKDPLTSITVNSLFPHQLAKSCGELSARLIHLSTDCVFSGLKGNYAETDNPDATDLYGRSKLLGELAGKGCLTIRTSMIGRELQGAHGLLEWFLSQRNARVRGFKRAIFSGFTTLALAKVIATIITDHRELSGVWHVASEPISKFDLLTLVKQTYGLAVEIEPDESFVCDRTLNGTRFRETTGIHIPGWPEMIEEMFRDPTPYDRFRSSL
jgi:dTDP-4-dehydrorhamnose reductase